MSFWRPSTVGHHSSRALKTNGITLLLIIKHAVQSLASYNGYKCFDWSLSSCEGSHDLPHVRDLRTFFE